MGFWFSAKFKKKSYGARANHYYTYRYSKTHFSDMQISWRDDDEECSIILKLLSSIL